MPTTMSPNRQETPAAGSAGPRPIRPTPYSRRRIGAALLILLLSAVVFCMAVVRQRDARLKQIALTQIRVVESWVRDYYKVHRFLPLSLDKDRNFFDGRAPHLDYPTPRQIPLLQEHDGPVLLICAPLSGMITPGGDGLAALIFDNGRIYSEWITPDVFSRMRDERRRLFTDS